MYGPKQYFSDLIRQVSQEQTFPLQQQSTLIDLHSIQCQADFKIIDDYVLKIEKIPHLDLNETEMFLTNLNRTQHISDRSELPTNWLITENYEQLAAEIEMLQSVDESLFLPTNYTCLKAKVDNVEFIPNNNEHCVIFEPIVDESLFEIDTNATKKQRNGDEISKKVRRLLKSINTRNNKGQDNLHK